METKNLEQLEFSLDSVIDLSSPSASSSSPAVATFSCVDGVTELRFLQSDSTHCFTFDLALAEEALNTLKKGTQLLKYGRKGKLKFYPFRLSSAVFQRYLRPQGHSSPGTPFNFDPVPSHVVALDTRNMLQTKVSGSDGFRVSVSSAQSGSSHGSGGDESDALGDVYIWGEVICDNVGIDKNASCLTMRTDVLVPKPLESNIVLDVHQIACGVRHAAFVTRQGEVFTWGEESGGRLGHGIGKDVFHPRLVESLTATTSSVDFVACGEFHTCAVTLTGELYTWGDGTHNVGLLEHGSDVSHWIPKRIAGGPFEGLHVASVSCGPWHTALVTSHGRLFTFGDGTFGVLGHGDKETVQYPREVESLSAEIRLAKFGASSNVDLIKQLDSKAAKQGKKSDNFRSSQLPSVLQLKDAVVQSNVGRSAPKLLPRLLGSRTRRLVCIAALFGSLSVVKARSSPENSTDSRVDALLSIMGEFGYNQLLADSWIGNKPCDWYGIQCLDGQIRGITLSFMNLTGRISKRFGDLTSVYALDLSYNRLNGTIPLELTRMKLLRSLDLSYNRLHGRVPHFKKVIPDTVGNPEIQRVPSFAWLLSGGALALALLLGVGIHYFRSWKRNLSDRASQAAQNEMVPQSQQNVALPPSQQIEILESENNAFSLETLREATQDFRHSIGRGSSGLVYQGKLKDGREIAVKKMVVSAGTGCSEFFDAEVGVLSRVRHRNIVRLHGYCIQGDERLLVYELMAHGSLSKHLEKGYGALRLDWSRRLMVALDVARGLEYLHTLASESEVYIHRDVKSANVLLGKDLRAKIADFGFVRATTEDREPMNTKCVGSLGYTAPEYRDRERLSRKADVYSFGVILLELITGEKAYTTERNDEYIATWFEKNKDQFWNSIDEHIDNDYQTQQSVEEIAELAGSCCATEAEMRPEMSQIVRLLSTMIETRERRNQASSSGS